MDRRTAEKVLEEVKAFTQEGEPMLFDADHEELSEGSWSICLEIGWDWTYNFRTKVPGVFVEPINNCILGVFEA